MSPSALQQVVAGSNSNTGASPHSIAQRSSTPKAHKADSVSPLFQSGVAKGGASQGKGQKTQPWKVLLTAEEEPSEDGKIVVACPKVCSYGSNVLGGS